MKEIRIERFISGYYPKFQNHYLVILGGSQELVDKFNRGDFSGYPHLEKEPIQPGSFRLEEEEVRMY